MDRGYTNFLTHLHAGGTKLPLQKIQASLSHYLAHASPLPTPLAGTVVSSPLFLALSYQRLQTLSSAFRYALHVKYQLIEAELEERRSQSLGLGLLANIFARGIITRIQQWVGAILKGLQGGHPILRLACCCGILLGMEDLRVAVPKEGNENSHKRITLEGSTAKGNVEDEVVVALAESMDRYSYLEGDAGWENEFRKMVDAEEVDALSLSLIMMSQCASLIPSDKLRAIPLQTLSRLLASSIEAAFQSGTYLSKLSTSCTLAPDGTLSVSAAFNDSILAMSASPLFVNIGPLSRLTARTISTLVSMQSREGLLAADAALVNIQNVTDRVKNGWEESLLGGLTSDEMTPEVQALSTNLWLIFKTILFSVVMISKEILQEAVYVSPTSYQPSFEGSKSAAPSDLALLTLRSLYNLSFVVYQFGGVASLTSADQGGGFKELKETFYLALDNLTGQLLLDTDDQLLGRRSQVEAWTREICAQIRATMPVHSAHASFECGIMAGLQHSSKEMVISTHDECAIVGLQNLHAQVLVNCRRAKTAFVLATIEQLIPVLSAGSLQDWVLPICLPILEDDEHREAYESAHSVLLAIFSSRAQDLLATPHADPYPSANGDDMSERQSQKLATTIDTNIAVRLLPLYTSYLIEVIHATISAPYANFPHPNFPFESSFQNVGSSRQGKLNVHQLRLAFSTVVRFASASVKATASEEPTSTAEKYGLTWYCIEALLNAIRDLSEERTRSHSLGAHDDHRHRLHLMLISTIPSLPLVLLPRVLDEIRAIIIQGRKRHFDLGSTPARLADREARYKELNKALLSEILEGVGDLEKDFVMRWWYDNRRNLEDEIRPGAGSRDHQSLGSARKKEVKNPDGALSRL